MIVNSYIISVIIKLQLFIIANIDITIMSIANANHLNPQILLLIRRKC